MRIISETEFDMKIREVLQELNVGVVTGPGRSGAVASVYASHILSIPFIPYGEDIPVNLGKLLIIDTAIETGRTLRKAKKKYANCDSIVVSIYQEPPRVAFWYEAVKPQMYKHETRKLAA